MTKRVLNIFQQRCFKRLRFRICFKLNQNEGLLYT